MAEIISRIQDRSSKKLTVTCVKGTSPIEPSCGFFVWGPVKKTKCLSFWVTWKGGKLSRFARSFLFDAWVASLFWPLHAKGVDKEKWSGWMESGYVVDVGRRIVVVLTSSTTTTMAFWTFQSFSSRMKRMKTCYRVGRWWWPFIGAHQTSCCSWVLQGHCRMLHQ